MKCEANVSSGDVQEPEQPGNVGHVRGLWQAKIPAVAILLEEGLVQYTLQAAAIAEEALVDRDLNLRPVVADGRDFEDALRRAGVAVEGERAGLLPRHGPDVFFPLFL